MAYEVSTASNLEDLVDKILAFLTTNTTLVADGEEWTVLRNWRDNIDVYSSNLVEPTGINRKTIQTFRWDVRSLNVDSLTASSSSYYASGFSPGNSYMRWKFRVSKEVRKVSIRANYYSTYSSYTPKQWRLQYSDDGSSWTTAITGDTAIPYTPGSLQEFAIPASGSHLYWQMILDSTSGGSTTYLAWHSIVLSDIAGIPVNQFGSEILLKSLGTAGTDEIFTGIRTEYDVSSGWYNLFLNGYTGYDVDEKSWLDQPGSLPGYGSPYPLAVPMVPCWDNTMPYWFVADGRCFRFAVKVSTNYEGGYLGFFLPYCTPGQYPYPLAVGGSLTPHLTNRTLEWRYSYASWYHGVYPAPGNNPYAANEGKNATLYIMGTDAAWYFVGNRGDSSPQPEDIYGPQIGSSAPYSPAGALRCVWPHCMNDQWTSGKKPYEENYGGGYLFQPPIILQRSPTIEVIGELYGTYIVSGYNNSPENTSVINTVTHVIFQNAYRNSVHEFWALSLDP